MPAAEMIDIEDEITYSDASVAVGTEIIPEDWITKANEDEETEEEEIIIEPVAAVESDDVDDIPFEIQQSAEPDESKAVDALEMEIVEQLIWQQAIFIFKIKFFLLLLSW